MMNAHSQQFSICSLRPKTDRVRQKRVRPKRYCVTQKRERVKATGERVRVDCFQRDIVRQQIFVCVSAAHFQFAARRQAGEHSGVSL